MNVLLVEDEARVADFVQRGLRAEGWSVSVASTGESALVMIADACFDVIVLDLMLPGISGQDVCRRLRAKKNRTPILMLSALADVEDRVAGLRIGADDYLPKPFDFDELMARIEALARRSDGFGQSAAAPEVLTSGALSFDTRSLEVRCGDTPINLTPKERDLLKLFLSSPRKIFSRERILSTLWAISEDPQTNVVDVYIGRLRKKLGTCGESIETVRGAGYRYAENGPG
ncbi:response regulator transcription factor [Thiocapsa sp.]|uniref:response regulator transcription factor n=1 Tax=Thiocapsa sp. TaxID=2024551 RepID=UPI0025DF3D34|nr:response regulator transcription factor [Thiocapsa sp.]